MPANFVVSPKEIIVSPKQKIPNRGNDGEASNKSQYATDPTEPDMVIGMAQAASGQYAPAAATFSGINQSNPASARVTRLWNYYVKSKANPATATAGQ